MIDQGCHASWSVSVVLLLLGTRVLGAESVGPDASVELGRRVQITLVGQAAPTQDLRSLLVEWLGSASSRVTVRRKVTLEPDEVVGASSSDNELSVWLVVVSERLARIYFVDAREGRFLVRDVPLRNALDELGRERVAQVLATAGQAFVEHRLSSTVQQVAESFATPLHEATPERAESRAPSDSAAIGRTRPSMPSLPLRQDESTRPATPVATADASSGSGVGMRGGAFYGVAWKGPEGLGHGPGILVAVGNRGAGWRWALSAKVQYQLPYRTRSERVEVRLQTTALRVGVSAEAPMSRLFAWGFEVGAGLDDVDYEGRPLPGQSLTVSRAGSDTRAVASFSTRGVLTPGHPRIALELGATVPLVDTHYDIALDGERYVEITAWRVQPGLLLEVSWQ